MKPVFIRWVDSHHRSGWQLRDEVEPLTAAAMTCDSVGFLKAETEHSVQIVQSVSPEEVDAIMDIPRCAILEMRDL